MAAKQVLVVDDEEGIRDTLRLVLTAEGYTVTTAPSVAAALDLLERACPAVILLDMSETDRRAFARAYRARPGPHAPLVVLTAAPSPADAARHAAEVGAAGYLGPPVELGKLLSIVAEVVAEGERSVGARGGPGDQPATGDPT
jgi:two-component system response regulator AtoC